MRHIAYIIVLLALFVSHVYATQEKREHYGKSGPDLIAVTVDGAGVEKPGLYYVKRDIELRIVIEAAKPSKLSNGRIAVTRITDGKSATFHLKIDRERSSDSPSFRLRDGDYVFVATNLP